MEDYQTTPLIESFANNPPDIGEFPYVGWVPTVNGRLSFRHIGESHHPTNSVYANIADDKKWRLVVGYQRRPLSDILFKWAIHNLNSITGDFWFAISARSDAQPIFTDRIVGKIYIFKSKEDWRCRADENVRQKIKDMNAERFSANIDRSDRIEASFLEATSTLENNSDIYLKFILLRTGEIYFSLPNFRDEHLNYASSDYATRCGHDFSKWISDQAFFYIRDISHSHQHHHPASDTILILQERDSNDEMQWRRNIIYSLYYAIIRSKRSADPFHVHQSAGVHAYCLSFKNICAEAVGKKAFAKFPKFNDVALQGSLDAKSQELIANATIRFSKAANLRTFVLAGLAILIATFAIFVQPRIGNDAESKKAFPLLHAASDAIANHFFSILFLCLFGAGLVWFLTRSGWLLSVPLGRDLLEVSNVRRGLAIPFFICLAIGSLGITVNMFWPAVVDIIETVRAIGQLFQVPES